jgi:hypothetical protein
VKDHESRPPELAYRIEDDAAMKALRAG